MDDLISRRAATRGCYDPKMRNADYHDFAQMIEQLPSAQPYTDEELQKMQDLEQAQFDTMYELGKQAAEPHWIPCSEPPKKDGVYIVYAPNYSGGSSSAKECHDGVMFSKYKKGKWSIEHGYYNRPNCVKAWMPLPEPWRGEEHDQ